MPIDEQPLNTNNGIDEQPFTPPTYGGELLRPLQRTGEEFLAGARQAFAPQYSSENPSAVERYVTTPASQLMGALRMAVAPITGLMQEPTERAARSVGQTLGIPDPLNEIIARTAGLGAGAMAPQGLVTAPLRLAQRGLQMFTNPARAAITSAEELSTANQVRNLASEMAGQQAQQASSRIAQREVGGLITSPLAQSVRAPQTTEQAFSFMQQLPEQAPQIAVPGLAKAANKITQRFENTIESLTPRGAKTAEQLAGEITPGAAAAAAGNISPMPGVPPLAQMTPQQQAIWGPIVNDLSKATSGKLDLPTLQNVQQGIGLLTRNTDPRTAGFAKHLYRNLMDDVRTASATSPEAAQFYQATRVARQNFAAEDLADIITKNGTTIDSFGRLTVKPGSILKAIQKNDLLKDLPPEEAKRVSDALENAFHAQRNVRAAGAATRAESVAPVPPHGGAQGMLHGAMSVKGVLAGLGSAALAEFLGTGIPHYYAFAAGNMSAAALPRAIFRAAMTPQGRALLNILYRDVPPTVIGPGAQTAVTALTNFLHAQDAQGGQ